MARTSKSGPAGVAALRRRRKDLQPCYVSGLTLQSRVGAGQRAAGCPGPERAVPDRARAGPEAVRDGPASAGGGLGADQPHGEELRPAPVGVAERLPGPGHLVLARLPPDL